MRKQWLILLILFSVFLLGRQLGLFQFHFAKFDFPDIRILLYDRDWYGEAYPIRDVTSHRWFEDGMMTFSHSLEDGLGDILEEFEMFSVDLRIPQKGIYLTTHHDGELYCINQVEYQLTQKSSSLFTTEYEIFIDADLGMYGGDRQSNVHDYALKLEAPFTVTGWYTASYLETRIQEFFLYRSLYLLKDYRGLRQYPPSESSK